MWHIGARACFFCACHNLPVSKIPRASPKAGGARNPDIFATWSPKWDKVIFRLFARIIIVRSPSDEQGHFSIFEEVALVLKCIAC
jgi:hypothetical protein